MEDVIKRTREMELANREMEVFTSSASHDLRAPLRAIDGFSEALLEDYADQLEDEGKTYLRYLQDSRAMSAFVKTVVAVLRPAKRDIHCHGGKAGAEASIGEGPASIFLWAITDMIMDKQDILQAGWIGRRENSATAQEE